MSFGPEMCVTTARGEVLHMGGLPRATLMATNGTSGDVSRFGTMSTDVDWVITTSNRIIGKASLIPFRTDRTELSIRLWQSERGAGRGTTAVKAVVCAAFHPEVLNLSLVHARARLDNHISQTALSRAGFYRAPDYKDPLGLPPAYHQLEQINPRDPYWTEQWSEPGRDNLPRAEILTGRRATTIGILTETVLHFCAQVDCGQLGQVGGAA